MRKLPVTRIERGSVDCLGQDWHREALALLASGAEVDLLNFQFEIHDRIARLLARNFPTEFELVLDRDPGVKAAYFRRKHLVGF
jgi:hypothetical protein